MTSGLNEPSPRLFSNFLRCRGLEQALERFRMAHRTTNLAFSPLMDNGAIGRLNSDNGHLPVRSILRKFNRLDV
jgi:hypothetical protein